MVVNDRPLKRTRVRKRISADIFDFYSFPCPPTQTQSCEPFRDCVKLFLSEHARLILPPSSVLPSLLTYHLLFRLTHDDPLPLLLLHVVEEDVTLTSARSVYCDHCRVVGWSGHPVCKKRYHFIIRAESGAMDGHKKCCSTCGYVLHLSESRCRGCNSLSSADDGEEWVHNQLEDSTHLLHGVVHSNGYGHLLTVNGREGGSKVLSGRDIMDFWDRLCAALSVRKVSVMDVSRKYGTQYRLLHAITKGHSWYSDWGYKFRAGSYALTQEAYQKAVDTLSNMPLSPFFFLGRKSRTHLQTVIAFYQSLSEVELLTVKDLFSFLLSLIHKTRKPWISGTSKEPEASTSNVLCAWTRDDVECVQKAMMKVLLAAAGEASWVTRRALKGAMSMSASPELLDYSLKHLGGKLAANGMVVRAQYNPISSEVEFRLDSLSMVHDGYDRDSNYPSEEQIVCDLKFLYDSILHPDTMVSFRPQEMRERLIDSATTLLDCKQFMKDYKPDRVAMKNPSAIQLWCHVELSDQPKDDLALPPELVLFPLNATVADLKKEATKAFQEVYAMFKRFQAEELPEFGSIEDSMTLKFLVGLSGSVRVEGRCPAKHGLSRFRMERGMESWTVDCTCGAKDDDGERMLACDTCGVWQHTRCAGIDNSDAIPAKFVCMRCVKSYRKESKRASDSNRETNEVSVSITSCRDEAVATDGLGVDSNMTF